MTAPVLAAPVARLRPFFVVCVLASTAFGDDGSSVDGSARVFVETDVTSGPVFVRQPVRVTLRIGIDRGFFEERAVQLFARRLDVPIHVSAPWWGTLADPQRSISNMDTKQDASTPTTLAVNDDVVPAARAADRRVDGRAFSVFELTRTVLPLRAERIEMAAPEVRFAYGSEFQEDLFGERVAIDRADAGVTGAASSFAVAELPLAGRPESYAGGVGRFEVRVVAARPAVELGQHFELRLSVTAAGSGDVRSWSAPRLDPLPGLHVYGVLDDHLTPTRTFTYDVAVLDGALRAVPSIEVSWFEFDPSPRYRVETLAALPLEVGGGGVDVTPSDDPGRAPEPHADSALGLIAAISIPLLLLLVLLWRQRSQRSTALISEATPISRLHERLECLDDAHPGTAEALAAALAGYVAERLGCEPASVIAPDLAERLERAGVPAELSLRTARLLESLVAARYGGTSIVAARADVRALAEELDDVLSRRP